MIVSFAKEDHELAAAIVAASESGDVEKLEEILPVPIKMKVYGVDYDNEHGIDMFTEEEAGTRRFKFPVVEQLCWEDAIVKAGSARVMRVLLERDGVRKSGHSGVEIARRVALYGWKRSADWAIRTLADHGISPWPSDALHWTQVGSLPTEMLPVSTAADIGDLAAVREILALKEGWLPAGILARRGLRTGDRPITGHPVAHLVAARLHSDDLRAIIRSTPGDERPDAPCLEAVGQLLARGEEVTLTTRIVAECRARAAAVAGEKDELRRLVDARGDRDAFLAFSASDAKTPEARAAARAWAEVRFSKEQLLDDLHGLTTIGEAGAFRQAGDNGCADAMRLVMLSARYGASTEHAKEAEAAMCACDAAAETWRRVESCAVEDAAPVVHVAAYMGANWDVPPGWTMPSVSELPGRARTSMQEALRIARRTHLGRSDGADLRAAAVVTITTLVDVCRSVAPTLLVEFASNGSDNAKLAGALLCDEAFRVVMDLGEDCYVVSVDVRAQLLLACAVLPPPGHEALSLALVHAISVGDAGLPFVCMLLSAGASPDYVGELAMHDGGPLLDAVDAENPAPGVLRALVERGGVDVNELHEIIHGDPQTMLSHVMTHRDRRVTEWAAPALLAAGARTEVEGQASRLNPLALAASQPGNAAMLERLIRAGADVHAGMDMAIRAAAAIGDAGNATVLYSAGGRVCALLPGAAGVTYGEGAVARRVTERDGHIMYAVPAGLRAGDWRVRSGMVKEEQCAAEYDFAEHPYMNMSMDDMSAFQQKIAAAIVEPMQC